MKKYKKLGFFPTPLQKLNNLSNNYSDYSLYIKRDDQTGLALGGNKTRKLEYLFQDAIEKGCDSVITIGAAQSNHCRQTAAAANILGLNCHLLLRSPKPDEINGNYLLDDLLGANIHWFDREEMIIEQEKLISDLKSQGKNPYLITIGGSNAIGTFGYVRAMEELKDQMSNQNLDIDHIVFASCSGGTHAGMVLGNKISNTNIDIMGISIEKDISEEESLQRHIHKISNEAAKIASYNKEITDIDIKLVDGYNDAGYGIVTELERNAIKLLAKEEGILLDPVYSGRAFGALLDLLDKKSFKSGSNILFWHTGGAPANFHYADQII